MGGYLPPVPPEPHDEAPVGHDESRAPIVMVIDDSFAVRTIVQATLGRVGMEAICFPEGLTAIKALTNGTVPVPDVLLLDIGLPAMDGYEVAKILRSNPDFRQTDIVMLSGRKGFWNQMRSRMVGACGYITKPFSTRDLVTKVSSHLAHGHTAST